MTERQRRNLEVMADAVYSQTTGLGKADRDCIAAALADLDAARKAMEPLVHALAIQAGPDQWPHRFPCVVWLTKASADAVLAAAGDDAT